MGRQLHIVSVPIPAQGHVKPLLRLSCRLAAVDGIKVTFVNTEDIHAKFVASSMTEKAAEEGSKIEFVSIPDGLDPEEDLLKRIDSLKNIISSRLENLVTEMSRNGEKVTCIIIDATIWNKFDFATKMGIKEVMFMPSGAGCTALTLHIPKLIEEGIIDENGSVLKDEVFYMSKKSHPFSCNDFSWRFPGSPEAQKILFDSTTSFRHSFETASLILCNTYYELDASACELVPNLLPIGPLFSSNLTSSSLGGNFWPEDSTSLTWLDKQETSSVVYVAFGSIAIFSQHQFSELALALENMNRPFLWVVRSDLIINGSPAEYPKGFLERVGDRGKIVEWAPQEKVLAHPSVGCFFSHCGWNSTLEGLIMGVPFLCWPYFVDQFQNQSYVSDIWKVGLKLKPDVNGIMTMTEIMEKIENLLCDDGIKANVVKLKEVTRKSADEGGSSFENFKSFVNYLKL